MTSYLKQLNPISKLDIMNSTISDTDIQSPTEPTANRKWNKYTRVTKEELISKYPGAREAFKNTSPISSIEDSIKDNEEKVYTWSEAYRLAAYYYDTPSIKDRYNFLEALKFNFSGILSQTENPHELPDLRNRRTLLNWVCQKHNSFLRLKNSENNIDCNVDVLLKLYGPNDNVAKRVLGVQEFFI